MDGHGHGHDYKGDERRTKPRREIDNGNGENFSLRVPSTWARVINEVGILGAIVLFLVYMGAQTLPAMSREIQVLKASLDATNQLQRDLLVEQQKTVLIMRQMCSSMAKIATRPDTECFK